VLKSRVTGPLGMDDTTFAPTPAQCKRLKMGSGIGASTTCEDTHATDGGGVGFVSYAAIAPGRDTAVLVVVNRTDFEIFSPLVAAADTLMGSLVTR
jgi:CubicO group peptidase (beta-lactamase class C family)